MTYDDFKAATLGKYSSESKTVENFEAMILLCTALDINHNVLSYEECKESIVASMNMCSERMERTSTREEAGEILRSTFSKL